MRFAFLGSPAEATLPLRSLHNFCLRNGAHIVGVVSQPARRVGRRGPFVDPPVATCAKELNLPVLQPESARDPDFLTEFESWQPDVALTVAYGQILNEAFLSIPKRATINIHPSLLPLYRGATPVQSALLNGDEVTGVCVLFTVKKLDAGAIIVNRKYEIPPDMTAGKLLPELFEMGGNLLPEVVERLKDPGFRGTPQEESEASHCTKIQKADGQIQWQNAAEQIYNRYRAYKPWPGSFTHLLGKRVVITKMQSISVFDHEPPPNLNLDSPGCFTFDKPSACLWVATGSDVLAIVRVKPEGKTDMPVASFWNGLAQKAPEKVFEVHNG